MLAVCLQDAHSSNIQPVTARIAQYIECMTMFTRGTASADDILWWRKYTL